MSVVVRALIIIWCIETMNHMMEVDHEQRRLQRKIDLYRKWNERLGVHIMNLETEHRLLSL